MFAQRHLCSWKLFRIHPNVFSWMEECCVMLYKGLPLKATRTLQLVWNAAACKCSAWGFRC